MPVARKTPYRLFIAVRSREWHGNGISVIPR